MIFTLATTDVLVPVWVAIILTLGTILTPVILRLVDWRRQDVVAAKVETAAKLLVSSNEAAAITANKTLDTVAVIHTLVNSTLTAALKAELDATTRELASLRKNEQTIETLSAIEFAENRIAELRVTLSDRFKQQAKVEAQQAQQAQQAQ